MRQALVWFVVTMLLASLSHAAPEAAPKPAKPSKTATKRAPARGAAVVCARPEARPQAMALARLVYRDAALRPPFDEAMARALMGGSTSEAPTDEASRQRAEIARIVAGLGGADEAVERRLLASLGEELGVALIVLVEADERGPSARVLRVSEQRFAGVTLVPKRAEGGEWQWTDATGMLRGLAPTPRRAPRAAAPPKSQAPLAPKRPVRAAPEVREPSDEEPNLLTSPWFWGGLGVVVSVGVTVLVLSQTAFKEPDVVSLEGRVAP